MKNNSPITPHEVRSWVGWGLCFGLIVTVASIIICVAVLL